MKFQFKASLSACKSIIIWILSELQPKCSEMKNDFVNGSLKNYSKNINKKIAKKKNNKIAFDIDDDDQSLLCGYFSFVTVDDTVLRTQNDTYSA